MARRDGAAIRKQRIQEIGKLIMSELYNHSELPLSKTVASLQYETGLTKDKIMEYLDILADCDRFVLDRENDRIRRVNETDESQMPPM